MPDCIDALESAYREYAEGLASGGTSRVETVLPTEDAGVSYEFTSIEGAVPSLGVMALRCNSNHMQIRTVNGLRRKDRLLNAPGGRSVGLILLFSISDLSLVAIIQDGMISAMRVGGTSALAARELSIPGARIAAVIGSGNQARAQLVALAQVRQLADVRVFSPRKPHREQFQREMSARLGLPVRAVPSAEEGITGAHIVMVATNSFEPVFDAKWIQPGMHVSSILTREVPSEMYEKADQVVVNVRSGYGRGKAGHYDDSADWTRFPHLGELLLGTAKGRSSAEDITFFMNNAGVGFQFAAMGALAYEKAEEMGIGYCVPGDLFLQDWKS